MDSPHLEHPAGGSHYVRSTPYIICDRLQKACKHEDRAWEDGILVNDAIPQSGLSFEALKPDFVSSMYCYTAKMRVPAPAAGACMTIAMRR